MDNLKNSFVMSDFSEIKASIGIIQSTVKTHGDSLVKINDKIVEYNDVLKKYVTAELDRFSEHILPPLIKIAVMGGISEHVKECNKGKSDIQLAIVEEKLGEASRKIDILKNEPTNKMRKMYARGEASIPVIKNNEKYDDEIKIVIPKKIIRWAIITAILALMSLLGIKGIDAMSIEPGIGKIKIEQDSEEKAGKVYVLRNGE